MDFVFDIGAGYVLFEAKYTENADKSDIKGIKAFEKLYGKGSVTAAYVVCNTEASYELDGVEIINIKDLSGVMQKNGLV